MLDIDAIKNDLPLLLKPSETMKLLNVSRGTLLKLAASGIISGPNTPGGRRRFSRDKILAYISNANSN